MDREPWSWYEPILPITRQRCCECLRTVTAVAAEEESVSVLMYHHHHHRLHHFPMILHCLEQTVTQSAVPMVENNSSALDRQFSYSQDVEMAQGAPMEDVPVEDY